MLIQEMVEPGKRKNWAMDLGYGLMGSQKEEILISSRIRTTLSYYRNLLECFKFLF